MAMVAKQGWNFISKLTSLVARIFKARYFPHTSFTNSHLGNNPSFVWRSIWKSRQVLLLGCRWRIGDGSNIKVMNEPWLREEEGRWVESPQRQGLYSLNIQDLMLPSMKQWDLDKVNLLFSEEMASKVLSVPLLDLVQEDKLIWDEEKDGVYSVKSGYRKLMRAREERYRPRGRNEWGRIWKIQAPPKAKHFLWRVCKECLPTRMRLRSRHVQCPLDCPLCFAEPEDDWHLFFNCESSNEAWSAMGIEQILHPRLNLFHNVRDFIFNICCHESEQVAGKMAMLLWTIWQNRNNIVWNDNKLNARQVGLQAAQAWNEWAMVQGFLEDQQQPLVLQQQTAPVAQQQAGSVMHQWQPPLPGYLKCNVDASFYNTARGTGGGWCLRDHRGRFILAGTYFINERLNTMEGEAIALKEAICEVRQRGFSHIIFESDSKIVVDAITTTHVGTSEFSAVISHIKSLLLLCPNFEVKFVKRQANMVAHSLARAAYSMPSRCIFESVPRCIDNYINNEMN
jgi:ribonuclease HI